MAWMSVVLSALLATSVPATREPAEAAPAGPSAQDRELMQVWAGVARNGSPRERALVAYLPLPGESPGADRERIGRQLRAAADAAPGDELVQWLWASASAESSGCDVRDPCPGRTLALARLTPDNARAWMPVVDDALARGDRAGASSALSRMAAASRYEEPFADIVAAWDDLLRRHPLPARAFQDHPGMKAPDRVARENQESVMAIAFAAAMMTPAQRLFRHCDAGAAPAPGPDELARCRKLAGLMLDSQTLAQRSLGNGLLRRAGGAVDPTFERRRDWWLSAHRSLDGDPLESHRYFEDLRTTRSEIRAIELLLQRSGRPLVPPEGWVYVAPTGPALD
jgi:hypothetical protein